MNLLEQYKKRLTISENFYAQNHNGAKLDSNKKLAIAAVLRNTDKLLSESISATGMTQRTDMAAWKKFCLNLTTVALPALIAHDLIMVSPMSSITGYVSY